MLGLLDARVTKQLLANDVLPEDNGEQGDQERNKMATPYVTTKEVAHRRGPLTIQLV